MTLAGHATYQLQSVISQSQSQSVSISAAYLHISRSKCNGRPILVHVPVVHVPYNSMSHFQLLYTSLAIFSRNLLAKNGDLG